MIVQIKNQHQPKSLQKLNDFLASKKIDVLHLNTQDGLFLVLNGQNLEQIKDSIGLFDCVLSVFKTTKPYKLAAKGSPEHKRVVVLSKNLSIGLDEDFLLIAGPCSVESEEQLEKIAKNLSEKGVHVMRGGVFKPRTSPYSFQGLGLEGLKLFRKVADKYNLLIAVEITSEKYLAEFEKYVDILQIGARNMQNYELLKAVGKTKKPVILKRGLAATYEDLLMSAEYILLEGNPNVILCERGIKTFENFTRNTLDISCVLAIKQLSHLPIIVDPSHACGLSEMVPDLSYASLCVGANGIMLEVHNDPINALSDARQSLSLDDFNHTYNKLTLLAKTLNKKVV